MEYIVKLNEEQEKFLKLYFKVRPLRPEHKPEDYPNLVVNNWINSLMKNKEYFLQMHKEFFGEDYKEE